MTFLFDLYAVWSAIYASNVHRVRWIEMEAVMLIAAMAALCAAGVTFYVRFLIALCKECRRERISYLVRLQPASDDDVLTESSESGTSIPRAA